MFKDFTNIERLLSRQLCNPAARTLQEEFLKNEAEISAEFNYYSFVSEAEVSKICPEVYSYGFSRRRASDPVRLMMELESSNSLEENY